MKIRIIIEYEPDVDHENISDSEMREAAYKELADWKAGHISVADFNDSPAYEWPHFAINVEYDR